MAVKHTLGPWIAETSTGHHVVTLPDNRIGAYCGAVGAEDDAESIANARLIAAAPDLLEALKCCWDLGIDSALVPMVKAAIAKAEGT